MIKQYQAIKLEWMVKHQDSEVPFVSFESALSYANGLASRGNWVKVIDPEANIITLEETTQVAWAEATMEEISGQERRRRQVD